MHGDAVILVMEELATETAPARSRRLHKALEISSGLIVRISGRQWMVPSQTTDDQYVVMCSRLPAVEGWSWTCTCPDATGLEVTAPEDGQCKHILAVINLGEGRKRALLRKAQLDMIVDGEQRLLAEVGRLYERTGEHRQEWRLLINAILELNQMTRNAWTETVAEFHAEPFDFATWQTKEEEEAA